MIVKVCGMREPENIRAVELTGADWMGFIFYPPSPRYVAACPAYLPAGLKRVGVFVNATADEILLRAREFGLYAVQLYGNFSHELFSRLKDAGLVVVRAVSVASEADALRASEATCCDYLLFDTKTPTYGGSGKTFDWNALQAYHGTVPFLISGGISPGSLAALAAFSHPCFAGVDLNSGFETAPAVKDAAALETFIKALRRARTAGE